MFQCFGKGFKSFQLVLFSEIWELSGNKNAFGMLHVSLVWVRFQKVELVVDILGMKAKYMFHVSMVWKRFRMVLVSVIFCEISELSGNKNA